MKAFQVGSTIVISLYLLVGCSLAPKGGPIDPLAAIIAPSPEAHILIIFSHGSTEEFWADPCFPGGTTTPDIIKGLHGELIKGRSIIVYELCTNDKVGSYVHQSRLGEPKVVKRSKGIHKSVRHFMSLGMPAQQIFLVGFSAGGWASLLTMEQRGVAVGGAIVMAPAFAGKREGRAEGWQLLHEQQVELLSSSLELNALVYSFENDPYNTPEDLQFLGKIAGVTLLNLSDTEIDGVSCTQPLSHQTPFKSCFEKTQRGRILGYISSRVSE